MQWVDWVWCAEIEKFPYSVLAHRHPGSINLGDVTASDFIARAQAQGPIDILVAGTPCQAFSVAGLRKSLDDDRGNLTIRLVEVVYAIEPRYLLWENVPGVLTTSDNAFGCFLGGLVGHSGAIVTKHGWDNAGVVDGPYGAAAWRILDAQYFGLAQRRKRVFVVFSAGDGPHPAEILFEFEGMRRDSSPSREAREDTTGTIAARTRGGGGLGTDFDCAGGLQAFGGNNTGGRHDFESETFVTGTMQANGKAAGSATQQDAETGMLVTHSLTSRHSASEDGTGRGTPLVPAPGHDPVGTRVREELAVRRLTVRECERLQGFPDDYTLILENIADGPRYKALGNSMAVPVIRWIGERIKNSLC